MSDLPRTLPEALDAFESDPVIRGKLAPQIKARQKRALTAEQHAATTKAAVFEANAYLDGFEKRARQTDIETALAVAPDEWKPFEPEVDIDYLVWRKQAYERAAKVAYRDLEAEVQYEPVFARLLQVWEKHVSFTPDDSWTVGELKKRQAQANRLRPLIIKVNELVAIAAFGEIPHGGSKALKEAAELVDARELLVHSEAPQGGTNEPDQGVGDDG